MRIRILLVEDDPVSARLFQLGAVRAGDDVEVSWVASLDDVAEVVRAHAPDVALVDLGLPGSRGLQTLEAFCRVAPDLPFFLLTGDDDPALVEEARQQGALGVLVKGEEDVLEVVERVRARVRS